jgi:hypothetical protein
MMSTAQPWMAIASSRMGDVGGTIEMSDWRTIIDEALGSDGDDPIALYRMFGEAADAAVEEAQSRLNDSWTEPSQMMETVYGAMVAYANQVLARMQAEDVEAGSLDHAFRAGQAYGVSCVLNHIIDRLRDPSSVSQLEALDAFSDKMHDGILEDVREIGLTIELLDAKGKTLDT